MIKGRHLMCKMQEDTRYHCTCGLYLEGNGFPYDLPKALEVPEPVEDNGVRQPSHYQLFDGTESIEVIARSMTVSEFRGFCFGNVLKYRLRAGKKSELATMEKDLKKAAFYQELFDLHKGKCYESE